MNISILNGNVEMYGIIHIFYIKAHCGNPSQLNKSKPQQKIVVHFLLVFLIIFEQNFCSFYNFLYEFISVF